MATGYFLWQKECDIKKIQKQIMKIFKLTIAANLLFFIWNILLLLIDKKSIGAYIRGFFSLYNLKNTIIFDDSYFSGHLWYLSALLYLLLLYYFVLKTNTLHIFRKVIIVLLAIDLIFGKYALVFFGKEFPYQYVRNFLFVGFPYFLIGGILKERCKIIEKKIIPQWIFLMAALFFWATSVLEKYLLLKYKVSATREHYLSTSFLVIIIFIFLIQYRDWLKDSIFEKIGREDSLNIYIIHPIVIAILSRNVHIQNALIQKIYFYIAPFMVFMISIILSVCWKKVKAVVVQIN